jgi:hypothetical protein
MYPHYQGKIASDCQQSCSTSSIVRENLLYLSIWFDAGWLVWPVRWNGWPVATMAWAAVVLFVQVLLKKHNCSGCYYYGKSCHLGWGRLASWMFRQDSGNLATGMKLSLFYLVAATLLGCRNSRRVPAPTWSPTLGDPPSLCRAQCALLPGAREGVPRVRDASGLPGQRP